ncbi:MAG TPA: hypothetical protein VD770_01615 [Coxiellaceae bacterium]|nr:hypothetical protein [Coxiellaceae bacterium]
MRNIPFIAASLWLAVLAILTIEIVDKHRWHMEVHNPDRDIQEWALRRLRGKMPSYPLKVRNRLLAILIVLAAIPILLLLSE